MIRNYSFTNEVWVSGSRRDAELDRENEKKKMKAVDSCMIHSF